MAWAEWVYMKSIIASIIVGGSFGRGGAGVFAMYAGSVVGLAGLVGLVLDDPQLANVAGRSYSRCFSVTFCGRLK